MVSEFKGTCLCHKMSATSRSRATAGATRRVMMSGVHCTTWSGNLTVIILTSGCWRRWRERGIRLICWWVTSFELFVLFVAYPQGATLCSHNAFLWCLFQQTVKRAVKDRFGRDYEKLNVLEYAAQTCDKENMFGFVRFLVSKAANSPLFDPKEHVHKLATLLPSVSAVCKMHSSSQNSSLDECLQGVTELVLLREYLRRYWELVNVICILFWSL